MNDKNTDNITKAEFTLKIEGDSEISAQALSKCLISFSRILTQDIQIENLEQKADLNVTAVKDGSFIIDFSLFVTAVASLLSDYPDMFRKGAQFVLNTFIDFLNKLKEESKKGSNTVNFYGNISGGFNGNIYINCNDVVNNVKEASSALLEDNKDGIEIKEQGKKVFSADKQTLSNFKEPPDYEEAISEHMVEHNDVNLKVKSPDFDMNARWEFYDRGKLIKATMEDEEFKENVLNGKFSRFGRNTFLTAKLRTEYDIDIDGIPIESSIRYYVEKAQIKDTGDQQKFFND